MVEVVVMEEIGEKMVWTIRCVHARRQPGGGGGALEGAGGPCRVVSCLRSLVSSGVVCCSRCCFVASPRAQIVSLGQYHKTNMATTTQLLPDEA